jgi:hypothetical protein
MIAMCSLRAGNEGESATGSTIEEEVGGKERGS